MDTLLINWCHLCNSSNSNIIILVITFDLLRSFLVVQTSQEGLFQVILVDQISLRPAHHAFFFLVPVLYAKLLPRCYSITCPFCYLFFLCKNPTKLQIPVFPGKIARLLKSLFPPPPSCLRCSYTCIISCCLLSTLNMDFN